MNRGVKIAACASRDVMRRDRCMAGGDVFMTVRPRRTSVDGSGASRRFGSLPCAYSSFFAGDPFAADLAETAQLFRSGKYAECIQSAEKAIAENDFSENYRLLKLRSEMELGRYADALKTLDEALRAVSTELAAARGWGAKSASSTACRAGRQAGHRNRADDPAGPVAV